MERLIRLIELSLFGAVDKKRNRDPYARVLTAGLAGALAPKDKAQTAEGVRIAGLVGGAQALPNVPAECGPLAAQLVTACERLVATADAEHAASSPPTPRGPTSAAPSAAGASSTARIMAS